MFSLYLVRKALLETLGGLLLDLAGDLGVSRGVGNALTVLVLHDDGVVFGVV